MGKFLRQLGISDLVQELAKRQLSTDGTKNDLHDRLELWVFRNGHNPKDYLFSTSLENLCAELTEELRKTRDERRVVLFMETKLRKDMKKFQESMISRMESLERKLEIRTNSIAQQVAKLYLDETSSLSDEIKDFRKQSLEKKSFNNSRKCTNMPRRKLNLSSSSSSNTDSDSSLFTSSSSDSD